MLFKRLIFFGIFPFLVGVFLLHYIIVGQAVYGDGIFYYAFTRSIYKDHDIQFKNELGHHYSHENNNRAVEEPLGYVNDYTKTGYTVNRYPVGAPLSWLPAFTFADSISNTLRFFNPNISNLGYSDIYQIITGVWNVLFVSLGLYLLSLQLKKYFSKSVTMLTIIFLTFATFLFYYAAIDVVNSLPLTFLLSCIFLLLFIRSISNPSKLLYFTIGMTVGYMAMTRTQEGIFLLLPVIAIGKHAVQKIQSHNFRAIVANFLYILVLFAGFLLVFSIQMYVWYLMYGTFTRSPYIAGKEGFYLLNPHLLELLINSKIGLLWWSPGVIIGILGLVPFSKKEKSLGWYFITLFVVEYYLIASWSAWQQGESFSVRMLTSTLPFLSFGIACLFDYLKNRFNTKTMYIICFLFILINFSLIIYFLGFYQSPTYDLGVNTNSQGIMKFLRMIYPIN